MEIIIKETDKNSAELKIEGEMSIYSAGKIHFELKKTFDSYSKIDIDLESVTGIDTAGFQLLLCAKKDADNRHKQIIIKRAGEEVKNIYKLYGESL